MKRISYLLFVCLLISSHAIAQGWASKAAKSVFTLKTFGADGTLIGSANGFFVSEDGDAVSIYAPFAGAVRAVVIDASGKELPIECMLGANEMYDVAKFCRQSSTGRSAGVDAPLLRQEGRGRSRSDG